MEDLFFFICLLKNIYWVLSYMFGSTVVAGDKIDKNFCLSRAYILVELK